MVYEDDDTVAFLNRHPTQLGSCLVAPRRHVRHVTPLPPGVPYARQQYHALMAENGLLATTCDQQRFLAEAIRRQI